MTRRPPIAAVRAYNAAREFSGYVYSLGGSLTSWASTSAQKVAKAMRQSGDRNAWSSLASFVESRGGNQATALRLLNAAIKARGTSDDASSDVIDAFWNHGLREWDQPLFVRAWRYGRLPEGGRSFNYAENVYELGVSVAGVEDGPTGFGAWQRGRPTHWLTGWWREDVKGSDGEPLIVGAKSSKQTKAKTKAP